MEEKLLQALESDSEYSNPHLSFFKRIILHLESFNKDEILEFQMAVLSAIGSINEKRRVKESTTYFNPFGLKYVVSKITYQPPNIQIILRSDSDSTLQKPSEKYRI